MDANGLPMGNFLATDSTGITMNAPNEATPEENGNVLKVTVMYEMEDAPEMQLAEPTRVVANIQKALQPPPAAPLSQLHIPYQSMIAKLGVLVNGELVNISSIIDSGAAQTAVSERWLRRHPELWEARRPSTHRFHGITGEPLPAFDRSNPRCNRVCSVT